MTRETMKGILRNQQGLTLVEIMIVLIIIGLMYAAFGQRLFGAGEVMKAQLTRTQLQQLKGDIEQFKLRYNKLPSSLTDLTQCTELTGPGCVPVTKEESLKDAWGNAFLYSLQANKYRITSLGADGTQGGEEVNFDIFIEGP